MKGFLKSKLAMSLVTVVLLAGAIAIPLTGSITHSFAASRSSHNIAYVNYDDSGFTGTSPAQGNIFADSIVNGPPSTGSSTDSVTYNGMNFTPLAMASLSTSSLAPFDTLILFEVCDIGSFTASQHAAINAYLAAGNKILLYDADRCAPVSAGNGAAGSADYSWFNFPFTTSAPGPKGNTSGKLTFVEKSTLTTKPNIIANDPFNSDELGDANTATTSDPHWFAAAKTTNALGVSGFFLAYARNKGLIIYDGADHWNTFKPTQSLTDLFVNELDQQYDPDNLPSTTPIASIPITKIFKLASCSSPVKVALLNVGDKVSGTASLTSSDPSEASQGENLLIQERLGPFMKTVIVGSGSQPFKFTEIAINDVLTACITGQADSDQTATIKITITPAPPSHPETPIEERNQVWSGYTTESKTYSTVEGLWIQPSVTCSKFETSFSSFWIGLDGASNDAVEQTGTDADCVVGHPIYYAWFEMFPAPFVPIQVLAPFDGVKPGDRMHAKVSVGPKSIIGKETFILEIDDLTQGWHFSTTQLAIFTARPHNTAECIVERTQSPELLKFIPPITFGFSNFHTVQFLSCLVDGKPIATQPFLTRLTLESVKAPHPPLDRVSDLTLGSAFNVTWLNPGP